MRQAYGMIETLFRQRERTRIIPKPIVTANSEVCCIHSEPGARACGLKPPCPPKGGETRPHFIIQGKWIGLQAPFGGGGAVIISMPAVPAEMMENDGEGCASDVKSKIQNAVIIHKTILCKGSVNHFYLT